MKKTVVRFTSSERWFHNIVMFSFVFLLITGLAMLFYNLKGDQGSSRQFLVMTHKAVSLVFMIGPLLALLFSDKKVWRENIKVLSRFGRKDIKWLMLKPLKAMNKKVKLPLDDKFNPGQKVWTYAAVGSTVILVVTGIIMWVTGSPILALIAHTAVAVIITPILAGHVFMAIINKETREGLGSIVDGKVDAEWAMDHHPLWMERLAKERVRAKIAHEFSYRKSLQYKIKSAKIATSVDSIKRGVLPRPHSRTA